MTVRKILRSVVAKVGSGPGGAPSSQAAGGPAGPGEEAVPWSPAYFATRERRIRESLADPETLDLFRRGEALPEGFGVGLDERCVEYPWLFSRLAQGRERLLDAGSALNHAFLLDHPRLRRKTVHILTLAPEGNCFWRKGVSYLYEDLRDIPVRDGVYDTVACISTLEHVGMDNSLMTASERHAEADPDGFLPALAEMRRVLRPGGTLFLTVPYGAYANFGTFQQFDACLVERAVAAFAPEKLERMYFRYSSRGWDTAASRSCDDAEYVPWIMTPPGRRPGGFPVEADRATAARAVACLALVKTRS